MEIWIASEVLPAENAPVAITESGAASDLSGLFHSNNNGYSIFFDGDRLQLGLNEHVWSFQKIPGGARSTALSAILSYLSITGTVEGIPEVSDDTLISLTEDTSGEDWTVTALKDFFTTEWIKVTVGGRFLW